MIYIDTTLELGYKRSKSFKSLNNQQRLFRWIYKMKNICIGQNIQMWASVATLHILNI